MVQQTSTSPYRAKRLIPLVQFPSSGIFLFAKFKPSNPPTSRPFIQISWKRRWPDIDPLALNCFIDRERPMKKSSGRRKQKSRLFAVRGLLRCRIVFPAHYNDSASANLLAVVLYGMISIGKQSRITDARPPDAGIPSIALMIDSKMRRR